MIHTVIDFPVNEKGVYNTDDRSVLTQSPQVNLLGQTDVSVGANGTGQMDSSMVPPALEKTRMCVYYLQGRCKYDDCSFAHSVHELKQAPSNLRKTKLCDLFMMGHCYDVGCNFAHSTDELKVKPKRSISLGGHNGIMTSNTNGILSPRSNMSVASRNFDKDTYDRNTESCARTILSMLIKMQPEAAVAFLSNPECKAMLEKLLNKNPNTYTTSSTSSPSTGSNQTRQYNEKFTIDAAVANDDVLSNSTLNTSGYMFSTPSSSENSLIEHFAGSFFVNEVDGE